MSAAVRVPSAGVFVVSGQSSWTSSVCGFSWFSALSEGAGAGFGVVKGELEVPEAVPVWHSSWVMDMCP